MEVDPDKANATTGVRAFYRQHHEKPDAFTWPSAVSQTGSGRSMFE